MLSVDFDGLARDARTILAAEASATFAPLVALFFTAQFGVVAVAVYLLSGALCTLAALRFNRRLRTDAV